VLKVRRASTATGTGKSQGVHAERRALSRSARLLKTQGRTIPWMHAAVYAAIVLVAAVLIAVWDHAYEARQAALFQPPPPSVVAKNLVEDIVGPNSVKAVSLDEKTGTLEMTVQDVLIKSGQSPAEQRKNVTAEGTLAIQLIQGKMPMKAITLHIVNGARALATVTLTPGAKAPTTQFAPALQ